MIQRLALSPGEVILSRIAKHGSLNPSMWRGAEESENMLLAKLCIMVKPRPVGKKVNRRGENVIYKNRMTRIPFPF